MSLLPYHHIIFLLGQMLARAHAHQWEELADLHSRYCHAIQHLRPPMPLRTVECRQRQLLVQQIITYDALLRTMLNPEMKRLAYLLGHSPRQDRLPHDDFQELLS